MLQPDERSTICVALQELQVRRKFCIKQRVSVTNRTVGLVARMLGFDPKADEAAREKLFARAQRIVKRSGKKQAPEDQEIADIVAPDLEVTRLMVKPCEAREAEVVDAMESLAGKLGLDEFISDTPGFKLHGLAVIVGEAGDLSAYPDKGSASRGPACLWRRFGLGFAKGHEAHAYSTWRSLGELSADDWSTAGYAPRRLAQLVGVVTVPLFMAKASNRYGGVYARRRAHTAITHPDWTKKHSDNDARRIITKALLLDLWVAWRRSSPCVDECPIGLMTAAEIPVQPEGGRPIRIVLREQPESGWSAPTITEMEPA